MRLSKFYSPFYIFVLLFMFGCGSGSVSISDKISKVEVFRTGDVDNILVGFTSQRIRDYNSLDILIGTLNISLVNTDEKATEDIAKLTALIEKLSNLSVDFEEKSLLLYVHDEPILRSYKEELIARNPTMLDIPSVEIKFKYIDNAEGVGVATRYVLIYEISNNMTKVTLNLFDNEEVVIPW